MCAAFMAHGDSVRALLPAKDASQRAALEAEGLEVVEGSVVDEASVARAAAGVEVVVHTEARSPWGGTLAEHERANLIGTENALAACREAGVRRFVFVSSEAVTAGDFSRDYVDETFPHASEFLSPYAETMALAEALVQAASGTGGMDTVVLRAGWLWGPGDDVNLPVWIRRQRAGTLRTIGTGAQFVPTTYIGNLADAAVLAATVPSAAGAIYYITDDERIGARKFLTQVLGAAGVGGPRGRVPYRLAYAQAWLAEKLSRAPALTRADVVAHGRQAYFNLGRARAELGYEPGVNIAAGVARLREWVQQVGGVDAVLARSGESAR
jgi:nucleoside-diphosphate-sugar epimerase